MQLQGVFLLSIIVSIVQCYVVNNGTDCYLYPESSTHGGQPVDDSASIMSAFELCGTNGSIIFTPNTFRVDRVMNTTNLLNCAITFDDSHIVFSTNVPYWLSHSFNVGLQNQSTAWLLGGTNLSITATPDSSIDGNGQTWYTQNRNNSNEPGRPITLTIFNSTDVHIDGLNIIQPQFWATFVTYSQNVTLSNIYVNATSNDEWGTVNTDGLDTWNSDQIVVYNWVVQNGDDCIAAKGNTTNLHVSNVTCHNGNGMTIGSVGQYPLTPDYVENVTFEDVTLYNCIDGAYIKTWQGTPASNTGNGDSGGGGSGYVRNVTFANFQLTNVGLPMQISQCIYSENSGDCDSSKMAISNVTWRNFNGTSRYNIAASLHCAAGHPCPDIYFENVNITSVNHTLGLPLYNTTLQNEVYQCANIINENTTSGIGCNHWAPPNYGQTVEGNVQ